MVSDRPGLASHKIRSPSRNDGLSGELLASFLRMLLFFLCVFLSLFKLANSLLTPDTETEGGLGATVCRRSLRPAHRAYVSLLPPPPAVLCAGTSVGIFLVGLSAPLICTTVASNRGFSVLEGPLCPGMGPGPFFHWVAPSLVDLKHTYPQCRHCGRRNRRRPNLSHALWFGKLALALARRPLSVAGIRPDGLQDQETGTSLYLSATGKEKWAKDQLTGDLGEFVTAPP